MNVNVFYITEEEKQAILRQRMEMERKANRKRMTAYERQYRILGVVGLIIAAACLYVGGEAIIGAIIGGFLSLIGFSVREEDRMEWIEE